MTAAVSSLAAWFRHPGTLAGCALLVCTLSLCPGQDLHAAAASPQEELQVPDLPEPVPMEPGPVAPPPLTPSGTVRAQPLTVSGPTEAPALHIPALENMGDAPSVEQLKALANRRVRHGSAAERNSARAAWMLGLLYLHGTGVALDRVQAQHWFERAWAMGERWASAGLAWCEIDGCRGIPTPSNARLWSAQLAGLDRGLGLYLEWLAADRLAPIQLASPSGPGLAQQEAAKAHRNLLERAARAGSAGALNELALQDTAAGHLPEALAQFRTAAAQSPAAAANASLLAARMKSADQKSAPPDTASAWFAEARRYHRGDGVPANYTEAIRLYQIAAASGSRPAQRMLEMIYSRPTPTGSIDIAWMQQLANLEVSDEHAVLSVLPPSSPRLFVRDPTPLYNLVPSKWRVAKESKQKE